MNRLFKILSFLLCTLSAFVGTQAKTSERNPILDRNFPDPTVIRAADNYFYAYATESIVDGKLQHIQVARSRNLLDWEPLPDALPEKPVWADEADPKTWAPHVTEADGKYFMYYSAQPATKKGLCLAVAVAEKPAGPFRDLGQPLKCGESFVNIDPMAFDDPRTGKRLLYWGSGFQPLKVQELAANRVEFANNSRSIDLIAPKKTEDPNDYQRLVEAPWVTYRNGYYYLFYSGDDCCGVRPHYAVQVARSRSALGPFKTLAESAGKANSVILEQNAEWIAPGHNSVLRDDAGNDWIFYHAINPKNRYLKKSGSFIEEAPDVRRVMLINRLIYKNNWVEVESGAPTINLLQVPKVKKAKRNKSVTLKMPFTT